MINLYRFLQRQKSLAEEVWERWIKAEIITKERKTKDSKLCVDPWHWSMCNFRAKISSVFSTSLYPLTLRTGGRDLKLGGRALFSWLLWVKYKWQRYLAHTDFSLEAAHELGLQLTCPTITLLVWTTPVYTFLIFQLDVVVVLTVNRGEKQPKSIITANIISWAKS